MTMNCLATPTQRTGEPEAPARASVSERFRRLKWNESGVACSGDFVADERLGFELWEAPRQPVVKPIFGQLAEYETVVALGRRLGLKTINDKEFFHIGPLSGQPIENLTEVRKLPTPEFPLYLINWKEASHTHTRTQNNAWLLDIKPANPLSIHPDTAASLGITSGDEVWVESKFGRVRAKVKTTKRMHPEVVGLQHGFGHTALGRNAKGRGTSDAPLRPTKADPLSGMALHKEACVKVYKA
jgi:hypothetical protein